MGRRFVGKNGVVTGGGSGLGRDTAVAFAREGATVAVAGRRPEQLAETVALIEAEGAQGIAITTDVSHSEDVAALVEEAAARTGGLDIAFNAAGRNAPGPLAELDEASWASVLATNLTGMWLSMKLEIAHMRERGGGVIVNIASNVGAHVRYPLLGAYAASKAGVSALTRAAAREYIGDGIRINAISPGPIDTEMSLRPGETKADRAARLKTVLPIGRVGALEEVAAAALWLASPEAAFVVGHDLVIDGGASA